MKLPSATLLSTALLIGCGEEDPDTQACRDLQQGSTSSIQATATADGAPKVKPDHRRYDITLTGVTGGKGGVVLFAEKDFDDYAIYLDASISLVIRDENGKEVSIDQKSSGPRDCPELKARTIVTLGENRTIHLGPTQRSNILMIIERASHALDD